jgi:phage tail-like protein
MSDKKNKYENFKFQVEVGGSVIAGFRELTLSGSKRQVEVGGSVIAGYFETINRKYPILRLKKGIVNQTILNSWRAQFEPATKNAERMNILLIVAKEGNIIEKWEFIKAQPVKFETPDLNAKGNDVAMETLEITFETIQQIK